MTTQELLDDAYIAYRGKVASRTPAFGSDKATVLLNIANRKIREWSSDPRNKWNSLFEIRSVGTLVQATKTYSMPTDFYLSSDYALIVKTDTTEVEYTIIKAQKRNVDNGQALYIHGLNPKTITFSQDLDTAIDGGELFVPGYYSPSPLVLATDNVPVDNPDWLVYIVAAELARNDPAKEDNFPTLQGMANEEYTKMSNANNDVGFLQPNGITNNMPQISPSLDIDWTL
jgi:hypothetical protein